MSNESKSVGWKSAAAWYVSTIAPFPGVSETCRSCSDDNMSESTRANAKSDCAATARGR